LFVLLPGMGDDAEDFAENGFVEELQSHGLSADIRATNAKYGYYVKGNFPVRLSEDVIEPAKRQGYRELWLVGPSMGGFGSLFYARHHPADVTGVLAIAPYLGDEALIEEIRNAGGLARWPAPAKAELLTRDNYQRELWRWLQAATHGREPSPLLYMGYGKADDLAVADGLLARELPSSHVFVAEGAHEWAPWRVILRSFLNSAEFAGHCRHGETRLK
jgi:pimeloyl-ACP methyl ester carboxylesterase